MFFDPWVPKSLYDKEYTVWNFVIAIIYICVYVVAKLGASERATSLLVEVWMQAAALPWHCNEGILYESHENYFIVNLWQIIMIWYVYRYVSNTDRNKDGNELSLHLSIASNVHCTVSSYREPSLILMHADMYDVHCSPAKTLL